MLVVLVVSRKSSSLIFIPFTSLLALVNTTVVHDLCARLEHGGHVELGDDAGGVVGELLGDVQRGAVLVEALGPRATAVQTQLVALLQHGDAHLDPQIHRVHHEQSATFIYLRHLSLTSEWKIIC